MAACIHACIGITIRPMETRTIADRVFHVADDTGRTYRVTRYAWLDNVAAEGRPEDWQEIAHLLMTEYGGILDPDPAGPGRFVVDGTGTLVRTVNEGA